MDSSNNKIIFEDNFAGELGEGWWWLRESPGGWRIRDGGLEICVEPGVAATVKNALVRQAPDRSEGTFAIEVTVTNQSLPTSSDFRSSTTVTSKPRRSMPAVPGWRRPIGEGHSGSKPTMRADESPESFISSNAS